MRIRFVSIAALGKICLFCGRGGKMSKEHLWPKWAQATIAPDQRGKMQSQVCMLRA
ncbi:MAG: hypothetical protein WAN93_13480 [Solirubrobacteraceae bacterium]